MWDIRRSLKSLENPTFLANRWTWLYWRVYRFSWANYLILFENSVSRISLFFPVVGYLILLSDQAAEVISFHDLSGSTTVFGLSMRERLILLYFGLVLIALSRVIYLWRRPHTIHLGPTEVRWVNYGLKEFMYINFLRMHQDIEENGHRTTYGKYYTDDWEAYADDARWKLSGRSEHLDEDAKKRDRSSVNHFRSKERHDDLLRAILIDRYYEYSARRKLSLAAALTFALSGYALFFVPSVELFLTVVFLTLPELITMAISR